MQVSYKFAMLAYPWCTTPLTCILLGQTIKLVLFSHAFNGKAVALDRIHAHGGAWTE